MSEKRDPKTVPSCRLLIESTGVPGESHVYVIVCTDPFSSGYVVIGELPVVAAEWSASDGETIATAKVTVNLARARLGHPDGTFVNSEGSWPNTETDGGDAESARWSLDDPDGVPSLELVRRPAAGD